MAIISRTTVIPLISLPSGVRAFGPVTLTDNISSCQIEIARATTLDPTIWPDPASQIQLDLEISVDGGVIWTYAGGGGAFGGIYVSRSGEAASTIIRIPFPQVAGRQIRGTLTVIGGPILTSGLLQLNNPTFDNANSVQGAAVANLTTGAWTIGGSNRLLVGGMGWSASIPPNYSTMKWQGSGGTALTQVGSTLAFGSFGKLAVARLIAPAAVNATLYGELSGNTDELCVGGVSFAEADQTTPLGASATNSGTGATSPYSSTVNVTSAANELVVSMSYGLNASGGAGTETIVTGAGQTTRWKQESINGSAIAGTMSTEAGAASVTMSEDYTSSVGGPVHDWGILGVSIKPAAAFAQTLTLLGVG